MKLENLPRLSIGTWPTPVRELTHVSRTLGCAVWAKIEEECGAWGGNKVRKLEFILAQGQRDGVDTFVSYGAGTSNWTSALAFHAAPRGFKTVAGLAGPIPAHYRSLYERTATKVVSVPWPFLSMPVAIAARATAGRSARSLEPGGSGDGDIGSVHAGLEVADAIEDGSLPMPRAIFLAAGTCGTAAGLVTGLALRRRDVPVVAVRVAPLPLGTSRLIERRVASLLRRLGCDEHPATVVGDDRFFKPGYAKPNAASREAIRLAAPDGIILDPTYAAKAFASLIDAARRGGRGPFLFLHTSPGPLPDGPA